MADIRVIHGDMREQLRVLRDDGVRVQSIVTDPPYHLTALPSRTEIPGKFGQRTDEQKIARQTGFMGKAWDGGDIAFQPETWRLCYDLLPPGGHMLCFGGTRRFHRLVCAIEDAGFECRDTIAWLHSQGFPKHKNALKPAMELICVARKPLIGTIAANVLAHGTGGLNIAACRIGTDGGTSGATAGPGNGILGDGLNGERGIPVDGLGRWPANVVHDGSAEVVKAFPETQSGLIHAGTSRGGGGIGNDGHTGNVVASDSFGDSGSAARFFYSAKADADDRLGSKHPTVKPVDLMRWLVRLVTPPNGTVLDPFAGSGTTGMACMAEGFGAILVEREAEYVADIKARIAHVHGDDTPLFAVAADD